MFGQWLLKQAAAALSRWDEPMHCRELVKSPEVWSQILSWLKEDDGGDGSDGWLLVNTSP